MTANSKRLTLPERSASRLLDGRGDTPTDRIFRALPTLLEPGDLLVFNDTRVIKARLFGSKPTGGQLELLVERFGPVWKLCKEYGVTFDLECHPSERAMGDIESAGDYIRHMNKAGFEGTVGFNLDGSHMEWQNVSVIDFIREYPEYIQDSNA